jgi:hypothetical protein
MLNNNEIEQLLRTHWPSTCDLVGEGTVQDIVAGELEVEPVAGGLKLDFTSSLQILASALGVIKLSMEIIVLYREKYRRAPRAAEVTTMVAERPEGQAVSRQQLEALVRDMCNLPGFGAVP